VQADKKCNITVIFLEQELQNLKMSMGEMGNFVVPTNAQIKHIFKKAKSGMLYDPMLR
jgi:hypothetical protein